jgi:hypothetical protein
MHITLLDSLDFKLLVYRDQFEIPVLWDLPPRVWVRVSVCEHNMKAFGQVADAHKDETACCQSHYAKEDNEEGFALHYSDC